MTFNDIMLALLTGALNTGHLEDGSVAHHTIKRYLLAFLELTVVWSSYFILSSMGYVIYVTGSWYRLTHGNQFITQRPYPREIL